MFGENSDYGAIDLLGVLGVNALGSHMAVRDAAGGTLRWGLKNGQLGMKKGTIEENDVPAFADFRFIGGTLAAVVAQFSGDYTNVRRAAHDLATGALGSYVATETVRRAAQARVEAAAAAKGQEGGHEAAAATGPSISRRALTEAEQANLAAKQAAKAGNPNYGYSW